MQASTEANVRPSSLEQSNAKKVQSGTHQITQGLLCLRGSQNRFKMRHANARAARIAWTNHPKELVRAPWRQWTPSSSMRATKLSTTTPALVDGTVHVRGSLVGKLVSVGIGLTDASAALGSDHNRAARTRAFPRRASRRLAPCVTHPSSLTFIRLQRRRPFLGSQRNQT